MKQTFEGGFVFYNDSKLKCSFLGLLKNVAGIKKYYIYFPLCSSWSNCYSALFEFPWKFRALVLNIHHKPSSTDLNCARYESVMRGKVVINCLRNWFLVTQKIRNPVT